MAAKRIADIDVGINDIKTKYPAVWEECSRIQAQSGNAGRTSFDAIKIVASERESFFRVFASDVYRGAMNYSFGAASHTLDANKCCFLRGNDMNGVNKVISTLSSLNSQEKLVEALKGYPEVMAWFEEKKAGWVHRPFDGFFPYDFTESQADLRKQVEKILAITPLRDYLQKVQECKIMYHEGAIEIYGKQVLYQEQARRIAAVTSPLRLPTPR